MVRLDKIRLARQRLQGVALHTPILRYPQKIHDRTLYLKPESLQPIGSFKLRGAYNKIASLSDEERRRGVVAYSSGNHGQGVAYAARATGVKAVIVMSENASRIKRDSTAALGAEIVTSGPASNDRKAKAEELAGEYGFTIVPPFNDEDIIAGAASIAIEIVEDLPDVQAVLVPVGGGGLLSGVAAAIKLSRPDIKVIGVEPELANDAQQSFRSGNIVELSGQEASRTIADGLRAQSIGDINFEHIQHYADAIITVNEAEILEAMRKLLTVSKLVVEPSGAVATAAYMFHGEELPAVERTVAVISGGSVEPEFLSRVLLQGSSASDEVSLREEVKDSCDSAKA